MALKSSAEVTNFIDSPFLPVYNLPLFVHRKENDDK
jgi:hypothetical protein